MDDKMLKRTPLYAEHVAMGAKIVPFAGWEMPLWYSLGTFLEHCAVREGVGVFDVSHMGEIDLCGPDVVAFLERMTCNFVGGMVDGQAQYTALTNNSGGVIDDLIIYRHASDHMLLCVNAANVDSDFSWLLENLKENVAITNCSAQWSLVAVQGPKTFALLESLFQKNFGDFLKPFRFSAEVFAGSDVFVARTGYTGEEGVEIFVRPDVVRELWKVLINAGAQPCGLAARDSLRLEVCYPLHGCELAPDISAVESGLEWIVKPEKKGEFFGRAILEAQKKSGAPKNLVCFEVVDRGVVRGGAVVLDMQGRKIGVVTSGSKTATVGKCIGMALISGDQYEVGTHLHAIVRDRLVALKIVKKPFYSRS